MEREQFKHNQEVEKQLKRIADYLEESLKMMKDIRANRFISTTTTNTIYAKEETENEGNY